MMDTDRIILKLIHALEGGEWSDPAGISPLERAIRQLQDLRQQLAQAEHMYDKAALEILYLRDCLSILGGTDTP